jgi:hypothetical protein
MSGALGMSRLAAFPPRRPSFLGCEFMSGTFRVRGFAAFAGDLPLLLSIHGGESTETFFCHFTILSARADRRTRMVFLPPQPPGLSLGRNANAMPALRRERPPSAGFTPPPDGFEVTAPDSKINVDTYKITALRLNFQCL